MTVHLHVRQCWMNQNLCGQQAGLHFLRLKALLDCCCWSCWDFHSSKLEFSASSPSGFFAFQVGMLFRLSWCDGVSLSSCRDWYFLAKWCMSIGPIPSTQMHTKEYIGLTTRDSSPHGQWGHRGCTLVGPMGIKNLNIRNSWAASCCVQWKPAASAWQGWITSLGLCRTQVNWLSTAYNMQISEQHWQGRKCSWDSR